MIYCEDTCFVNNYVTQILTWKRKYTTANQLSQQSQSWTCFQFQYLCLTVKRIKIFYSSQNSLFLNNIYISSFLCSHPGNRVQAVSVRGTRVYCKEAAAAVFLITYSSPTLPTTNSSSLAAQPPQMRWESRLHSRIFQNEEEMRKTKGEGGHPIWPPLPPHHHHRPFFGPPIFTLNATFLREKKSFFASIFLGEFQAQQDHFLS